MSDFDGYGYGDQDDYGGYEPAPLSVAPGPRHAAYDIESLLADAVTMVENAKPLPMSNSVRVAKDELLEILDAARRHLPEEIREARWALRDREELMAAEIRKAEQLMDRVRAEAARMVDKTEIMRQARTAAERIVEEAEERARTLINEAEDFCDQKLGGMEIVLDRLTKTVRSGRERLRPQVSQPAPEELEVRAPTYEPRGRASALPETEPATYEPRGRVAPVAPVAHYDEPVEESGGSFFDQDQL